MSAAARFALFLGIVLLVWTGMHAYVLTRLWSLPWVAQHFPRSLRWPLVVLLWLSYPAARFLAHAAGPRLSFPVEFFGAVWMGVLFLGVASFFAADVATGFGKLAPALVTPVRTAAAVLTALLSVAALAQWQRGPRVVRYDVAIPGLASEQDGLLVVQLTDLHLGSLLGERWISRRVDEVAALKPDLIVVTGDLVDGETATVKPLVPILRRLHAPLGVWGVTGNHEFYAGLAQSAALHSDAGIRLLRDGWAVLAPGLVLAGVDDLSARRQLGLNGDPVRKALEGRPAGTTIFLSHSPLRAKEAAALGANLMISGHTHGGQIWPFGFAVAIPYPYLAGRFEVDGLTLLVSRGTGTWGPPMRLFGRSEILAVTLRRARP